jgi:peptide/nickel transport system permease protein
MVVISTFVALALTAPWVSPMASKEPGIFQRVGRAVDYEPHPPSEKAFLGTLPGQFDVFHALVWGIAEALRFGLMVAGVSALIGVFMGAVSGYAGGFINSTIMRITDAFLAFPVIAGVVFIQQLVAITITSLGGMYYFSTQVQGRIVEVPTSLVGIQALLQKSDPLLISLILFSWMPFTRLVNTLVITLKQTGFVQAARALGAGPFWIIRRHLMPHTIAPVLVLAARDVGAVVIFQATLTFIGIGGNSTWGRILAIGRNWVLGPGGNLFTYWWVFMPATLAVILFGVAWNLLADGINEVSLPPSEMPNFDYSPGKIPVIDETAAKFMAQEETSRMLIEPEAKPILHTGMDSASLTKARAYLNQGNIQEAVHTYRALIQRDYLVEKIIRDLNRAVERNPREAPLWEVLGEAYNHNGQLTQAIEAYSQVIEQHHRTPSESSHLPPN